MEYQSLVEFEKWRSANQYIPPIGSNSFYTIGNGQINILTKEDSHLNLFTDKDEIEIGDEDFTIDKTIYDEFTIIENTTAVLTHGLHIIAGTFNVHGTLIMEEGSKLIIQNHGIGIFYPDATINIHEGARIIVDPGASLTIYSRVDTHVSAIDQVTNNRNVTLDSAAVVKAYGIQGEDFENRPYSLTDYDTELRAKFINLYTQGETNSEYGRFGYRWMDGDPDIGSQIISLGILYGEGILGDFRLSILGFLKDKIENLTVVSDFFVEKDCTLYISESYQGKRYLRPELYLGIIINNYTTPASCKVRGTIIVDGINSKIFVDRGATIHIEETGIIELKNQAQMISSYNDDTPVLFIDGTLIVDTIDQIKTFEASNIQFGEKGKVIIRNPDPGVHTVLWSTPNGIHDTDLYRMFEDTIDHVEYHISNNTGIQIDQYCEFYARDMTNWYGGRRIEKAVHDGILVWDDGGFIELNHDVIPWVDVDSTLFHASRIFKSFGSFDADKLQEVVNRLRYAGFGDIVFRFIHGDTYHDITLVLDDITMKSVVNKPMTETYILNVEGDNGQLYLRNKVSSTEDAEIIQNDSRIIALQNGNNEFDLKQS